MNLNPSFPRKAYLVKYPPGRGVEAYAVHTSLDDVKSGEIVGVYELVEVGEVKVTVTHDVIKLMTIVK
ncbi:MAG TPA: hypothetical protein VM577_18015 [Anaerovoracaceae bacterium]|nr:hypothetical protein [Anaerovoracaceae bacterium]